MAGIVTTRNDVGTLGIILYHNIICNVSVLLCQFMLME